MAHRHALHVEKTAETAFMRVRESRRDVKRAGVPRSQEKKLPLGPYGRPVPRPHEGSKGVAIFYKRGYPVDRCRPDRDDLNGCKDFRAENGPRQGQNLAWAVF